MSAKQAAVIDIQEDLSREGKCFIAFIERLDPIMEKLVEEQSCKQLIASIV